MGETVGMPEVSTLTVPAAPPALDVTEIVHVPAGCTLRAVTVNDPDGPAELLAVEVPATIATPEHPELGVAVNVVPAVASVCVAVMVCVAP